MSDRAPTDRVVDHLLDSLLELATAERQRRLGELGRHQPALAARLARLLAHAHIDSPALQPGGALGGELAKALLDTPDTPVRAPGDTFCGYYIEELIGHGGMSEVYRATRDHGEFRATVALKVLHHQGRDNPALRAYLRHEQRALARLDHPGIARFIDAGEGPEGELYLATEYVEGESIADYADRCALPLKHRVDLLIALCHALEHAHARRLVHGDVRSANVLIDPEGRLRLVDFGIASEAGPALSWTVRAFTPECAAPEQRRGDHVTTGTDVFQVGALAWRLLSGRSRLDGGESPASLPSAAARLGDDRAARAKARGQRSAGALARALRGDLDAIILRCLAHDADARYPSCTALREDLERWRRQRPVKARPTGPGPRLAKFLRRNADAATMVGPLAALGLLITGAILLTLQSEQRTRLAEAERALRVEQFLGDLFRSASPYLDQDGRDPLATFADLGDRLLREQADMDARTRARLTLSLAQLQLARGNSAKAAIQLDQADRALAGEPADRAPRLHAELLLARAQTQALDGNTSDAVTSQQRAVELLEQAGEPALDGALARAQLGDLERRRGDLDAARTQFQMAMPVILADPHAAVLASVHALDRYLRFLSQDGQLAAIGTLAPRVQALAERTPAGSLAAAELTSVQAELDSLLVGSPAAARRYQQAAERFQALLGDSHPRLARAVADACVANMESGAMALAQQQCQRAQTIYFQARGPESEGVAVSSLHLGVIAYNTGRLSEADAHLQRALRLLDRQEQPHRVLLALISQSRIARMRGRHGNALEHLELAERIRTHAFAGDQALAIDLDDERAATLIGLGQVETARALLQPHIATSVRTLPADSARRRIWLDATRARLAAADGDGALLQRLAGETPLAYEQAPGRNDLERGWLLSSLAQAALAHGDKPLAARLFGQALDLLDVDSSGVHWAIAHAGRRLSGGAADPVLDLRAAELLRDEGIDNALARAFRPR